MAKDPRSESPQGWRPLAASAGWWAAVLVPLALGALLQAGPGTTRPAATPPPAPPAARLAAEDRPAAGGPRDEVPEPAAPPDLEPHSEPPDAGFAASVVGDADLADRAAEDERRLHASGPGYTLQFAVVCDPDHARTRLAALRGDPDFYLLTTLHRDRACFRLCWGFFDAAERADSGAARAPAALRGITDRPRALSTDEALP